MKKIVLALTTILLSPNMSYAAACADGALKIFLKNVFGVL